MGVIYARSHVSSVEEVTLLDSNLFGVFNPELDIGPHKLVASNAFLSLQNR